MAHGDATSPGFGTRVGPTTSGAGDAVEAYEAAGCGTTSCGSLTSVTVPGTVVGLSVATGRLFVSWTEPGLGHLTAFAPSVSPSQ